LNGGLLGFSAISKCERARKIARDKKIQVKLAPGRHSPRQGFASDSLSGAFPATGRRSVKYNPPTVTMARHVPTSGGGRSPLAGRCNAHPLGDVRHLPAAVRSSMESATRTEIAKSKQWKLCDAYKKGTLFLSPGTPLIRSNLFSVIAVRPSDAGPAHGYNASPNFRLRSGPYIVVVITVHAESLRDSHSVQYAPPCR